MILILRKMIPLFIVQFFTWLALFALWIYATPVITRYYFNSTDAESPAFEDGTAWVGFCFAFYSLLAAFLAFYIPRLVKKISKSTLHGLALLAGGLGLSVMFYLGNKYLLFISFAFIGIAWSSIANIPYQMISEMAEEEQLSRYLGVFNFSIVIPQVSAAFLLGYMNKHLFSGETKYMILCGGVSMLIAGVIMLLASEPKEKLHT
jgi:maltose/moltooligosaccharide transporter